MTLDLDTLLNIFTILIAVVSSYAVMRNEIKNAKEDVQNIYRLIEAIQSDTVTHRDMLHIDKRLEKIDNQLQLLIEHKIKS